MHFFKQNGKQHLDLSGDLVITTCATRVTARSKSAAPTEVHEGRYILLRTLNTRRKKLAAVWLASITIWRAGGNV